MDVKAMSEITRERLERAIVTLAYIVVQNGPRYAPLLERLEEEHRKRFADPVDRARAILDRYRSAGQPRNAILLSNDCK
jgi:hypothetical protein